MSEYHSQEAFEQRMRDRAENPIPLDPVAVFYHISCMPGWEPVIAEQLALAAHVGIEVVNSCILGTWADADRCRDIATMCGIHLEVLERYDDFGLYEGPTLKFLHEWAGSHPNGAVIYFRLFVE